MRISSRPNAPRPSLIWTTISTTATSPMKTTMVKSSSPTMTPTRIGKTQMTTGRASGPNVSKAKVVADVAVVAGADVATVPKTQRPRPVPALPRLPLWPETMMTTAKAAAAVAGAAAADVGCARKAANGTGSPGFAVGLLRWTTPTSGSTRSIRSGRRRSEAVRSLRALQPKPLSVPRTRPAGNAVPARVAAGVAVAVATVAWNRG